VAIGVLKEYLVEYVGNIMIVAGIVLLAVGVLSVNIFGSIMSVFTFFFGIICVAFGFFARIGLFYRLRSLNGLGTILVCVSVAFFALSVALLEFLSVKGFRLIPIYYRGVLEGTTLYVSLYRPYAWLSFASLWVSIGTFLAGLIVKVYCYYR
jgi:hypothetical protein